MATYKQIQTWVKQNHGFVPQTCWIADVKSKSGLAMGKGVTLSKEELRLRTLKELLNTIEI